MTTKRGLGRDQIHEVAWDESYPHPLLSCMMPLLAMLVLAAMVLWGFQFWQWTQPRDTTVPPVTGMAVTSAKAALHDAGLRAKELPQTEPNEQIPADAVISTNPPAGRRVKSKREVTLLVSAGSAYTTMPDVRELPLVRAQEMLRDASLLITTEDYVFHDTIPYDRVVSTTPKAGAKLRRFSPVVIKISKGAKPTEVAEEAVITDYRSNTIAVTLPTDVEEAQTVRIDVTDGDGKRTVYEKQHDPGSTVVETVQGNGDMKVEVFFGNQLILTRTM